MLLQTLKNIINQNGKGSSFFDYRMKQMNYPEQSEIIRTRIEKFFTIVDSMFLETGKRVGINPDTNTLIFYLPAYENCSGGRFVTLEQLSSGEKQLLINIFFQCGYTFSFCC